MNTTLRTRSLTEGAMMAVITAILALIGINLPFLKIVVNLVWTIPIVLVTVRHGLLTGTLSIGVAGLLILSFAGPVEAVLLVLQFGALALFYGYAFHNKFSPGLTLLVGAVISVLSIIAFYGAYFLIAGINFFDIAGQFRQSIEPTIRLYKSMGLFTKYADKGLTEESMRQMLDMVIQIVGVIVPGLFIISGLSSAFLNYFIAQQIISKVFRTPVPALPLFRLWRLPWWIVWGFIAGFGSFLIGTYWQLQIFKTIGLNIMMIYWPVAFVLGLSVFSYFMHKTPERKGTYRLLMIMAVIFFFQYAILLIAGVGIADLLFNYRRLPG